MLRVLLLAPAAALALQITPNVVPLGRSVASSPIRMMAEAEASLAAPTVDASMPMEKTTEVVKNERFRAISLDRVTEWAEKFPRLKPKLQDIQRSGLIFPFKASPYLVEELIERHGAKGKLSVAPPCP